MTVYRFNCLRDANVLCIGKTKCRLVTRVREHSNSSAVCEHLEICDVCRSEYSVEKNFRILDKGKNDFEITIKESLQAVQLLLLQIKNNRPPLNKKLMTQSSSFLMKIFG